MRKEIGGIAMNTNKTSFWEFIGNHDIEIPIIQRDYAQGRIGKEYLRRNFLVDLKKALDGQLDGRTKVLKLDFVYSSVEGNKLQPLDGQQRLTTLWLLHWYIALRAGKLAEAASRLKKFSYETRISSREFCENLCNVAYFETFDAQGKIVDFIINSTWFFAAWKQDPTIQAMLRMLSGTEISDKYGEDIVDGLEELFTKLQESDFVAYWDKLTSADAPIAFYHLPLQDFALSDDLYIKMNARGKQLTAFENFKADLIGYMRERAHDKQLPEEERAKWKELLDVKTGIPILLDTDWMNIFWEDQSESMRVDEIYYAFMNRFFWNELFIAAQDADTEKRKYILPVGKGVLADGTESNTIENENQSYLYLNKEAYTGYGSFSPYRYYANEIPIQFFFILKTILGNYAQYAKELPKIKWLEKFEFIPRYTKDGDTIGDVEITKLSQPLRVVFFAVCKYFKEGTADEVSLARWLRVVRNLVSGQSEDGADQIRSTQAVRTAIEYIDKLDSHDVYHALSELPLVGSSSDIAKRWNEEVEKAQQIIDASGQLRPYVGVSHKGDGSNYATWEELIIDAENWGFFKGAIRFLFHNAEGELAWNDFDTKWTNAQQFFKQNSNENESALNGEYVRSATLLKRLISRFTPEDFWEQLWWSHKTFNNLPQTWLYYLLNSALTVPVHALLMGEDVKALPPHDKFDHHILYQLSNTGLLDYVVNNGNARKYHVREYYDHKAIYPSAWGIFLDTKDRDDFLLHTDGIEVASKNIVGEREFLLGWDINFRYNHHNYQWYRDDYIYLMSDSDENDYVKRDTEKKSQEEKYYCFKYQKGSDMKAALDKLYNEYQLTKQ